MTNAQKASYVNQILSGQQKGDSQRIYNFIKKYPFSNIDDIARNLNKKISTVTGRISELHDIGLVEPSGKFKNKSGYVVVTNKERIKRISLERSKEKMQRDLKRFVSNFNNADEAKEYLTNEAN